MKNLDNLYEAYQNYKKLCIVDNDTARFLRAYMNVKDKASEDILTVFSVCHIEQDWVEAIEVGLPFFEKAIKEERQFIRNDGEVLPIEKIRKTSKASIQDLAKHANYITHEAPEDAETEVLPDKMLMIQKESDFAIYENRVLYAGLMYLKDFVASRLVEIKETTNTYIVKQHINKLIDMGSRKINIELQFDERRVNDPLLTEKNTEKDVIDRLDEILTGILALLKTPLMREVSKVEMVSRPIAKTNILKMNRNFRESLACFEYIANYQGKGFTIEHVEKSLIPYSKQMNEAYTESIIMLSFLNYMFANNLSQELKNDYEAILKERELRKENEVLAKLRDFHASADDKEQTINEFLIAFEQGYRILEERNDELTVFAKETEARRQKELKQLEEDHQIEIEKIKQDHHDRLAEAERDYNQGLVEAEHEKEDAMRQFKESSAMELQEYKDQFKQHIGDMKKENAELKSHFKEQDEKIARLEAEILNSRIAKGEVAAKDFNGEDEFDRLEKLKAEFDAFYEKAWKEAKKRIRKETLLGGWGKKKKKGQKTEEEITEEPATMPVEETKAEEQPVLEEPQNDAPIEEPQVEENPIDNSQVGEVKEEPREEDNQTDEPNEEAPAEEPQKEQLEESNDEIPNEGNQEESNDSTESINNEDADDSLEEDKKAEGSDQ